MGKVDTIELLSENGIDVEAGMEKCANDQEIYLEVLEMACKEGKEKVQILQESIENHDFYRYEIETHGLKNAAKIIGCANLAEKAYKQEVAAREGREDDILNGGYHDLIEHYKRIITVLDNFFLVRN